jgi:hypothetical protein
MASDIDVLKIAEIPHIEDFTQQVRKYRTIRPNVHLQFSKDPPDWVVEAIKRAGGTYNVSP